MTIMHNNRYRRFENDQRESPGDHYRGQPDRKFPWLVIEKQCSDQGGDTWHLEALCDNVVPNDVNQICEISLRFTGSCDLSSATLGRLGFDPSRLKSLNDKATQASATQSIVVHIPLAQLERVCQALISKFHVVINKRYDDAYKMRIVKANIDQFPISRFAD